MTTKVIDRNAALDLLKQDPTVGIKVTVMAKEAGQGLLAARIEPGRSMVPHSHASGGELYAILSGCGLMRLGVDGGNGMVKWQEAFEVKSGDCYAIPAGVIHSLKNPFGEILEVLIAGETAHLGNDRTIFAEESL